MYLINLTLLYPLLAITDIQKIFQEKIHRINQSEYIKFVETQDHNIVAFSIVMPSFSKALQNKRKAIPFGLYIYLKLKNKVKMSFSI
jgi:hypothetical protein